MTRLRMPMNVNVSFDSIKLGPLGSAIKKLRSNFTLSYAFPFLISIIILVPKNSKNEGGNLGDKEISTYAFKSQCIHILLFIRRTSTFS